LGDGQLWRIDPTGQFWKCNAIVLGRDADKAEAALYKRLTVVGDDDDENENDDENSGQQKQQQQQQQQQNDKKQSLDDVLQEMTSDQAIKVLCDCMNQLVWPDKPTGVETANTTTTTTTTTCVYWQAVVLKDGGKNRLPKRIFRRGAFLPPNLAIESSK
jgi:20S proteasome alpha/beta subunit